MNIKEFSIYLDSLKVSHLKTICKRMGIKRYSKWKKNETIINLKLFIASRIIQRTYRKHKMCNDVCYITYENVKYPCYPLRLKNGKDNYYNLPDLVDYFLTSGSFREPVTKRDLSIKELNSLDMFVKKVGIKKKNLCDAKKNEEFYRKQIVKEHHVNVLQDQVREIVCIIRERLETDDIEDSTAQVELTHKIMYLPALRSYFRELNIASKQGLKMSFSTSIKILKDIKISESISKVVLRDNIILGLKDVRKKYFS